MKLVPSVSTPEQADAALGAGSLMALRARDFLGRTDALPTLTGEQGHADAAWRHLQAHGFTLAQVCDCGVLVNARDEAAPMCVCKGEP